MDYESCRSLPAMFFEQASRLGDEPFLWSKQEGQYRAMSWAQAARDARRLALGLRSLGIARGQRVALVSENRPEWIIADLAIMSAGAITVPAYVTHTVEDHRHVLSNSGARSRARSSSTDSPSSSGICAPAATACLTATPNASGVQPMTNFRAVRLLKGPVWIQKSFV